MPPSGGGRGVSDTHGTAEECVTPIPSGVSGTQRLQLVGLAPFFPRPGTICKRTLELVSPLDLSPAGRVLASERAMATWRLVEPSQTVNFY